MRWGGTLFKTSQKRLYDVLLRDFFSPGSPEPRPPPDRRSSVAVHHSRGCTCSCTTVGPPAQKHFSRSRLHPRLYNTGFLAPVWTARQSLPAFIHKNETTPMKATGCSAPGNKRQWHLPVKHLLPQPPLPGKPGGHIWPMKSGRVARGDQWQCLNFSLILDSIHRVH